MYVVMQYVLCRKVSIKVLKKTLMESDGIFHKRLCLVAFCSLRQNVGLNQSRTHLTSQSTSDCDMSFIFLQIFRFYVKTH